MKVSMKAVGFAVLLVSLSLCMASAQARNVPVFLPIQDAISTDKAKTRLSGGIEFYFGDQPHPAVEKTLAQGVVAYKKGSITLEDSATTDKAETKACHVTMLAALAQLQEHARRRGGDAVVNIESYYKKVSFKSNDQYECRTGHVKTGVMLRGDVVRLKR